MWINILFSIIGFAGGVAVAGGTFALLVKIGVFTRLVEMARTAKEITWLETAIVLGGICGNIVALFSLSVPLGIVGIVLFGIASGMYVGWLHMALAEMLSVFSVGFRRLKLKYGIGVTVCFIGIGKLVGALIYFYNGWGNNL